MKTLSEQLQQTLNLTHDDYNKTKGDLPKNLRWIMRLFFHKHVRQKRLRNEIVILAESCDSFTDIKREIRTRLENEFIKPYFLKCRHKEILDFYHRFKIELSLDLLLNNNQYLLNLILKISVSRYGHSKKPVLFNPISLLKILQCLHTDNQTTFLNMRVNIDALSLQDVSIAKLLENTNHTLAPDLNKSPGLKREIENMSVISQTAQLKALDEAFDIYEGMKLSTELDEDKTEPFRYAQSYHQTHRVMSFFNTVLIDPRLHLIALYIKPIGETLSFLDRMTPEARKNVNYIFESTGYIQNMLLSAPIAKFEIWVLFTNYDLRKIFDLLFDLADKHPENSAIQDKIEHLIISRKEACAVLCASDFLFDVYEIRVKEPNKKIRAMLSTLSLVAFHPSRSSFTLFDAAYQPNSESPQNHSTPQPS